MFPDEILVAAHKVTSYHRDLMVKSSVCGCCYCLRIFPVKEIGTDVGTLPRCEGAEPETHGADGADDWGERAGWIDHSQTALCPYCSVDCLIPEAAGYPLTPEFLTAMHQKWFG